MSWITCWDIRLRGGPWDGGKACAPTWSAEQPPRPRSVYIDADGWPSVTYRAGWDRYEVVGGEGITLECEYVKGVAQTQQSW